MTGVSYKMIRKRKAKEPSHRTLRFGSMATVHDPHPRDQNLRLIRKYGRAKWKRLVDYHRRSIAETTMFRFKTIFGPQTAARTFANQVAELKLKAKALNKMTHLAKPVSYLAT